MLSASAREEKGIRQVDATQISHQQTFLDLGQKSHGKRTLCCECGMLYVNGAEEDERQHTAYCRKVKQALIFPGWKDER
jgi:hypothetical protein